jgi:2'-5' RNA ligase
MSDGMVRAFIAVFPPADVQVALDAAIAPVRARGDGVAWVAAPNLHVTLRFLGELDPRRVEAARRALAAAVEGVAPFACATGTVGAFPGPARPRILWIGAREGGAELVALAARVEKALGHEGFPPADKPFTPHLTVGRVRADAPRTDAAARFLALAPPPQRFDVAGVTLVASTLGPGGARYAPLFAATLVAPGPPAR